MKIYVLGYAPKGGEPEVNRPGPTEYEVVYGKEPDWSMDLIEDAESESLFLERMHVHLGEHYCRFSVEELPDGEFAIVCLSHPDGLSSARHGTGQDGVISIDARAYQHDC